MPTTVKERTVNISSEYREVYVTKYESENREVYVPAQNRTQTIGDKRTTPSQRTVLVE